MAMEAVASIFGLNHTMLTIFASDILRVGAHGFGLLQSARGLGAVIGSSIYIGVGQRPYQGKILFVSALLYGGGFALFGISPSFLLSLLLMGLVGATDTIWGASRGTILQIDHSRYISRPSDGSFSIKQSRAPSAGTSSIWPAYSVNRGAGGHGRRRAGGISSNFFHRLESAGDLAISLGRQIRGHPFRQEYCGVKTTACDSDWRFADQFESLLRGPW